MPASQRDKYLKELSKRTIQILGWLNCTVFKAEKEAPLGRNTLGNLVKEISIPNTETLYRFVLYAKSKGVEVDMNWYILGIEPEDSETAYADLKGQFDELQGKYIKCLEREQSATRSDSNSPGRVREK